MMGRCFCVLWPTAYAGSVTANPDRSAPTRERDGIHWVVGTSADVAWINDGTTSGLEITSGIPPIYPAYCTLELPDREQEKGQERHDQGVIELLSAHGGPQTWWLGYLETGPDQDVVFRDAPRVTLYAGWHYVLVEAGPRQAATWRGYAWDGPWKGPLPDLMFPADRSWLVSTLWDDDWTCIGGSEPLVAAFLHHPEVGARARRVALGEDATPPGHVAR